MAYEFSRNLTNEALQKMSHRWDRSPTCLVGKTVIVSGASSGIGYYTARDMAKRGARVILACRSLQKAETTQKDLIEETDNVNIVVRIVDLASFASVRSFAKKIHDEEDKIDILINNAGMGASNDQLTEDGLDVLFQSNHFGPFLLTILLLDLIKKSKNGKIINVSSVNHNMARLNPNTLGAPPDQNVSWREVINYSNSKLCNILFTKVLAEKLRPSGIRVNAVHPGAVATELMRDYPKSARAIPYFIMKVFGKTLEEGAQTTIYVAVSKEVEKVTGEYFDNSTVGVTTAECHDEKLAQDVWKKTVEIVKLTSEERNIIDSFDN